MNDFGYEDISHDVERVSYKQFIEFMQFALADYPYNHEIRYCEIDEKSHPRLLPNRFSSIKEIRWVKDLGQFKLIVDKQVSSWNSNNDCYIIQFYLDCTLLAYLQSSLETKTKSLDNLKQLYNIYKMEVFRFRKKDMSNSMFLSTHREYKLMTDITKMVKHYIFYKSLEEKYVDKYDDTKVEIIKI